MNRTFNNQPLRRFAPKTSQQLFRRIDIPIAHSQSRISRSSKEHRNFPNLSRDESRNNLIKSRKSLDNSKENLMFESFLQKVNSASRIDEKSIVANYLNSLRKDYDKMHKQAKQNLSTINLKKKDIDFMKDRVKAQQTSFKDIQQKMEQKMKQMENIKEKQQDVQTEKKTLDHLISRMKKDQIFYKQFGRVFQGYLNEKKKVLKSLNQDVLLEDDKIHKLLMSIDDMQKELEKNQQFRERKLQDYCQKLQSIHEKEIFIQQRNQRTIQLQSIESNDIVKAKNLEMRNICLINKVADSLFQSKIQRLIETYADIQKAFHTIQVKTSINDPNLIASKFFSYGELTENLLKSISNHEKELEQKTRKNHELKEQLKRLQEKAYTNDSFQLKKQNAKKMTSDSINQANERHLIYNKIVEWIDRQAKRLKILESQSGDEQTIERITKKFNQICLKAKSQTQQIAKTSRHSERFVTPGIRIKKIIKEAHLDKRNQTVKQAAQAHEESIIEDEFLKSARAGVRKNFMIKQKTTNLGNLNYGRQSKNELIVSDQKLRVSERS